MMCQCRVINCNNLMPLVGHIVNGGDYGYLGKGGIWEIMYVPPSFAMKLKLFLKNKFSIKKIKYKKNSP